MVSLSKVYSGNALTRQIKRTSQELLRTRKNNAERLALVSGVGFAFAKLLSPDSHPVRSASILIGAISGSLIYHYGFKNSGREAAKIYAKELKSLKASDEYQNTLERAKSIKKTKYTKLFK